MSDMTVRFENIAAKQFGFSLYKQDILYRPECFIIWNGPLLKWDIFSYAHESITAMLSIHPLNQTPRCWNAFGENVKICETTTICGSVANPVVFFRELTIKQRGMFLMGFTLHQTSSHGRQSCPQWNLRGYMIAGMMQHSSGYRSSLSDGFSLNLWR